MSKDEEIKEMKEEIEELKEIIKDLAKRKSESYKHLDDPHEPKPRPEPRPRPRPKPRVSRTKAERQLENDLDELKDEKSGIHRKPLRPMPPMEPIVPDFHFEFDTEEWKKRMEEIKKNVEKASKEGMKTAQKISEKISKELGKLLEKETARITKASKISKEELNEINAEIESARKEIGLYQHQMETARHSLRQAREEVRTAQRRIDRARERGNTEERRDAEEALRDSLESLNDVEEEIRDSRSDLAQARREFARLQRRASKIHAAQSGKKPPHVIRMADADVDGTMSEYITKVMDSVGKSLESTFRSTLKGGKDAIRHATRTTDKEGRKITTAKILNNDESIKEVEDFYDNASLLLSALGDDNRLKILKILEDSPQYQKELAEDTGLRGGTFKHHTDILQEANFVTREAIRGRYLITQLGIEALKLAEMIYLRKKRIEEEDEAIDIEIED